MRKEIITFILLLIGLISCEETVQNPDLPYEEQLVISGLLAYNQSNPTFKISKTLHPLETFNYDKAIIKDAIAYLNDGENQYPLIYDSTNQNYYAENFKPEIGKSYTLTVKWKDKIATGFTYIPDTCKFEKFEYTITENIQSNNGYKEYTYNLKIYAFIIPDSETVYTTTIESLYYTNDAIQCLRYEDRDKNGKLKLLIINEIFWSETKISNDEIKELIKNKISNANVKIISWHPDYYKYFQTRFEGQMDDFIFGTSGKNIQGNIKNGIGFYYGYSFIYRNLVLD